MNILNLFFEVVLSVGPFVIFSKMGDGKNSGNLLFKSLKSTDSSVSFNEDFSSITFSTVGGGGAVSGIEIDEIAWGTGTGITSSTIFAYSSQIKSRALKVDKRSGYESIIGVSNWAASSQCYNYVSGSRDCNNMIIAGRCNNIEGASCNENNLILGGNCNYIYGRNLDLNNDYGCQNVILAGRLNKIDQSQNTIIVGGNNNEFSKHGRNSVILASDEICLPESSINSSFISSSNFTFSILNSISNGFENTNIISSNNVSNFNALFGVAGFSHFDQKVSEQQIIASSDIGVNSSSNTIISSKSSYIFGTFSGKHSANRNVIIGSCGAIIWGSSGNLILASECSGVGNRFDSTTSITVSNNSLISTYKSCICAVSGDCCYLKNSAIIGGVCNSISKRNIGCRASVNGSVIINGCLNSIYNSDYTSIVSSIRGTVSRSYVSVMVGSDDSIIQGDLFPNDFGLPISIGNVIMTSCQSVIDTSQSSAILSSMTSTISCALNSIIISSCGSYIDANGTVFGCGQNANMIASSAKSQIKADSSGFSGTNTLIAGIGNTICHISGQSDFSGIISGSYNSILKSSNSFILSGEKNCIDSFNSNYGSNGIVGGMDNKILSKPRFSVIVGGECNKIEGDSSTIGASIVGGCNICNKYAYTTMVPQMRVQGNIWMCGFTGPTGTWSSTGAAICVCNGLIVCIS
jgi:hypothetical protein